MYYIHKLEKDWERADLNQAAGLFNVKILEVWQTAKSVI